jgi:hypothetical protein
MSLSVKSEFVYLFPLHALLAHKIRRKRMWGERNNIEGMEEHSKGRGSFSDGMWFDSFF